MEMGVWVLWATESGARAHVWVWVVAGVAARARARVWEPPAAHPSGFDLPSPKPDLAHLPTSTHNPRVSSANTHPEHNQYDGTDDRVQQQ